MRPLGQATTYFELPSVRAKSRRISFLISIVAFIAAFAILTPSTNAQQCAAVPSDPDACITSASDSVNASPRDADSVPTSKIEPLEANVRRVRPPSFRRPDFNDQIYYRNKIEFSFDV